MTFMTTGEVESDEEVRNQLIFLFFYDDYQFEGIYLSF